MSKAQPSAPKRPDPSAAAAHGYSLAPGGDPREHVTGSSTQTPDSAKEASLTVPVLYNHNKPFMKEHDDFDIGMA